MNTLTLDEIQAKAEIIKKRFIDLATEFEAETGTHLHLSVHHKYSGVGSEILTCDVKIPEKQA